MGYVVLLVALSLSAVAAWYSVAGLMVLFAAAAIPVAIMASTLEVAKLVTASWLYNNWKRVPIALKGYLSFAVLVLMFVTSLGIFGFLSKAHLDQAMPAGDILTKLEIIDQKIAAQQDLLTSARTVLKQLDEAVNQSLGRGAGALPANATAAQMQAAQTAAERNTNAAATLRRNQQKERDTQQANINKAQAEIQKLRDERAPVAAQQRTLEAEVGPIKYVAELIWGSDNAKSHFDSAVRFLIITLIFVFDPLAVLLVIAANMTFAWAKADKAINDQITDSVTSFPETVNSQITDAVTQSNIPASIKDIAEASVEAAASSGPLPFVPRQEAGVVGQSEAQEPSITEINSNIKIEMSKDVRSHQIAAIGSHVNMGEMSQDTKTEIDKAAASSIIEPLVELPEEDVKAVLMQVDDNTLEQVYARIVEETREKQPEDTYHKPSGSGVPPGTVIPPPAQRRRK